MKMQLPEAFLSRMKEQLGTRFPDFLAGFEKEARRGIRINQMKTTAEEVIRQAPFHMEPVPWVENGFFVDRDADPAGHPFYRAGLYYIQEPSAMTPADRLAMEPGDTVLDLCAAPGGKATALAAKLGGRGLLVANEVSSARCRALVHNLELFGADNCMVTNERPDILEHRFPSFFDKILVDAPCSGEGMFRKEPAVAQAWSPERVRTFAALQRSILKSAVRMLKPGGYLMYSTCTFSPEENEGSIGFLLKECPQMTLAEIAPYPGFSPGVPAFGGGDPSLTKTVRIWPHLMEGEGHFLALLRKEGADETETEKPRRHGKNRKNARDKYDASFSREEREVLDAFLKRFGTDVEKSSLVLRGQKVYRVPFSQELARGLRCMRCGLYMGECRKGRFEPSQALALWTQAKYFQNHLDLSPADERVRVYLQGGDISWNPKDGEAENGLILVCADGAPLGFGKLSGEKIKNKYLWLK